jgi:hypothetical protein
VRACVRTRVHVCARVYVCMCACVHALDSIANPKQFSTFLNIFMLYAYYLQVDGIPRLIRSIAMTQLKEGGCSLRPVHSSISGTGNSGSGTGRDDNDANSSHQQSVMLSADLQYLPSKPPWYPLEAPPSDCDRDGDHAAGKYVSQYEYTATGDRYGGRKGHHGDGGRELQVRA